MLEINSPGRSWDDDPGVQVGDRFRLRPRLEITPQRLGGKNTSCWKTYEFILLRILFKSRQTASSCDLYAAIEMEREGRKDLKQIF